MTSNMELWDSVSKTDPKYTKKVNQRGGFTAIDAHYQIQEATRAFGPIGKGWGYIAGSPLFEGGAIIIPITVWHGDKSNTFGPVYGCSDMSSKRLDVDAPKKATTDGLTKALSLLGFNADVFLGKFDDNKYVKEVAEEIEKSNIEKLRQATYKKHKASVDAIKEAISNGDISSAAEAWFELEKEEKESLWVAPSKGGVFTTQEREIIKSSEFRQSYFGEDQNG